MTFDNYFYIPEESPTHIPSYEEELLLNYDNFLEGGFSTKMQMNSHYYIELGEVQDDLHNEFEPDYSENNWKEEHTDDTPAGEYDENEEEPGSFEMLH